MNIPPKPTAPPLGPNPPAPRPPEDSWWWTDLYDPAAGDTNATPAKQRRKPKKTKSGTDDGQEPEQQPAPRRSLRDRLPLADETPLRDALRDTDLKPRQQAKVRALVYWGTAAGAGWWTGLSPMLLDAMTAQGEENGVPAGVWMGIGFTLFGALIAWRLPLWIGRIPLVSAVLALALYGPDAAL